MGAVISLVKAVVSGANIVNTINNFVKDIEEAGDVWDVLDATAGMLIFGGVKPSLLVGGTPSEIWDSYKAVKSPAVTRGSFYTRMSQRYDQIKDDPDVQVDSTNALSTQTNIVLQDTVIEMIQNTNTLYVTSQIWADYAFSQVDTYPNLLIDIHDIVVGPIEPEDTTENPNVVPFTSIDDVYHGYKYARTFTLQTEITTIGPATFSRMESLEEIIVEAEENGNGREHQHYSTVDGILFSKDGTILIAYPPNRKVGGVVATTYTIPSTVTTIGEDAFAWTKLSSVTIPTSVTTIGRNAFQHMHALTNITVDPNQNITFNTDTSYATDGIVVSGSAFSGTYSTSAGNEVIDQPTTNNFYESMSSIVSPTGHSVRLLDASGVQIGSPYQVNLDGNMVGLNSHVSNAVTIEISAATTTLLSNGSGWLYLLNLEEITLETPPTGSTPNFTVVNGVLYDYAKTVALKYPPRRPVPNTEQVGNELVLEPTITSISERAFFDMRYITKITIPSSVVVIKKEAFMHQRYGGQPDSYLREIVIPSGSELKTIGRHAFQYCRPEFGIWIGNGYRQRVETFTIPKSVETIEAWAFYGMSTKISFETGSKIKKIGYQSLVSNKYGDKGLPEGLLTVGIDAMDGVTLDNGTSVLNVPASVVTLERGSMSISGVNTLNFAKRSNLSGLSSELNSGDFAHPWNLGHLPVNIRAYGPLLERLEWGSTNNGTWSETSSSGQTQTSAWGLGGYLGGNGITGQGIQQKYSYVVSFTMSTTTLAPGDSSTVNIEFLEPASDFDYSLDITIYDTNTANIRGDVGTLSAMTTSDEGKNWTGIFTPAVDMIESDLVLRLDNVYYRNNDTSDASVAFSMNTTRTPLNMYVQSKSINKDEVAEIVLVFPDASSGSNFISNNQFSVYNSDTSYNLTNDNGGEFLYTSYKLTHSDTLADMSIFGFVPNRILYDVLVIEGPLSISLIGNSSLDVYKDSLNPYTDQGAIIRDVSNNVMFTYSPQTISNVTLDTVGSYSVVYDYPLASNVTRTVNVIELELIGDVYTTVEKGNNYIDAGVTNITGNGLITTIYNSLNDSIQTLDTNIIGEYTIIYIAGPDDLWRYSTVSRYITVQDTLSPTITLIGNASMTVEKGVTYTDAGATALDYSNVNLTSSIQTINPVNMNTVGTYIVRYNVTDASGNQANEVTRTVTVVDTTAPIITLIGNTSKTVELGGTYTDAGASALDYFNIDLTNNIQTTNPVNTSTVGTYIVRYNVTDAYGNQAIEVTRTVSVVDTTAPTITLIGNSTIIIEKGDNYVDAGASSLHLTNNIQITNPVNTTTVGTYIVRYNLADASGNQAPEVTRTVIVQDTIKPIITLIGNASITVEKGYTYVDAGASALDHFNVNLTSNIQTTNPVNTSMVGSYTVRYNVTDASGNQASEVTRTVNVQDTIKPIITLIGNTSITVEKGDTYTDEGAIALDYSNVTLTSNIQTTNPVDMNTVGTYIVRYNVADASGNQANEVTRTVIVQDLTKPIMTVIGNASITVEKGDAYVDEGASAMDYWFDNLSSDIQTINPVNTSIVGIYIVRYNVTDVSGNQADEVTRTVTVQDTIKPIITLIIGDTSTVERGDTYVDAGASATDYPNINLSSDIQTTNPVNTSIVGTYIVRYNVTDASGNQADEVTRTVIVRKIKPVITLVLKDVIIDVGDVYNEPGVSVLSGDGITDVSNDVQRTQIDTNVVGVYTVEYTYTEPSVNTLTDALDPVALTVTRQVTVGIGPVIQVQGPERMWVVIEPTNTYNDLGAKAIDQRDGDVTNNIIVSSSLDTSVLGTYTITYDVTDSDGIKMTATRTVYVIPPPSCFPMGTPVQTDQGDINIEKLTKYNTIRGSSILSVTRSVGHTSVISIPKSSLYKNVPSQDTYCSLEHKIFYNGLMIKARDLVNKCNHVTRVPHDGAPLYNVLLPTHSRMVVNNLIAETLHPKNAAARLPPRGSSVCGR